jgi:CRP-like cAMP-binding protein
MQVRSTTEVALALKLAAHFDLTADERRALSELPFHVRSLEPRQDISREWDRPSQCCVLLEGMACRYKIIGAGKRQIFSFHIAGDIPDLQSLHLDVMDHNLGTVSRVTVGFLPHETMRAFLRAHPRISDVFWRDTLIEGAIFREWIAGLGARSAYTRLAHLFCELFTRMRAVGLASGESHEMPLPLTQAEMGEAMGLSLVHINRTLKALRGDGLIETQRASLVILDWAGLQKAGEFDPVYLHLRKSRVG